MIKRTDVTKMFIVDFNFVVFKDAEERRLPSAAHDYADIDAQEVYDYALSLGNNTIFCHAYTINGCATYPTKLGPVNSGQYGNLLPSLYDITRKNGLPFWSYFCVGQDSHMCSIRPNWIVQGSADAGNPLGFLAPETPWTDLLCARIEEFLTDYKVDWLLFDGFVYGSFNPNDFKIQPAWYMKEPFKEIIGRDLPETAEEITQEENLKYKREVMARQFYRIRDAVRKTSPDTKICFNVPYWRAAEEIWIDHPMLSESDGLVAETANEDLVEYLLKIKKPEQRLFLTVINCLDGFRFDTDSWKKWYERGCDFHGYAWGTPPDWRPAPRFDKAIKGFRNVFTQW